jgi:transposase, IS30 family
MGYAHLVKSQRLELSILRSKGYSYRDIAHVMKIHYSTVSREIKRNSMRHTGEYVPEKANHKAYRKRKYSKYDGMKISRDPLLFGYVVNGLKSGWSPEEISGRLKLDHARILSFKIIYKWLYSPHGRGYARYLCSRRYQPKKRTRAKLKLRHIPNRVSIESRPSVINERLRIGDFEGDTMGKPKYMPETLVAATDRKSRFLVGRKVKRLSFTVEGFKSILPVETQSLTLDNGLENVRYEKLKIPTYFCHPYSSWEKGTMENTFQRLRRFIPKKANLANYSHRRIAAIIEIMNNTPRKCLGYRTPAEIFKEQLRH